MMMMMVVLCGQRVQAVHDHGGRRVGETSLFGPAYHGTDRTHYTVLVTARRGGEPRRRAGSVGPERAPGICGSTPGAERGQGLLCCVAA